MSEKKQLISKNTSLCFRGIAILMVVFSHYFEWGESVINPSGFVTFMKALGDPGVGIFFFLSGYALYKGYGERRPNSRYIWSRIKNMYLPYLLISGFIVIYVGGFDSFHSVIRWLLGFDYWFIAIIMVIYIAFFLVGQLPKWRITIMTLFILCMSMWLYIKGCQVFWYDANWCFALGMILAKYDSGLSFVKRGFCINIKSHLFGTLGRVSLYVYMLHSFLYMQIMNKQAFMDLNISWYGKMFINLVIAIFVAIIFERIMTIVYSLIERTVFGKRNN